MTGFSPFQLIYAFDVRGPLEALRDNWIDGNALDHTLIDWVEQMRTNFKDLAVIAGDRTALAKVKMEGAHDANVSSLPNFSMFLVRAPGLVQIC